MPGSKSDMMMNWKTVIDRLTSGYLWLDEAGNVLDYNSVAAEFVVHSAQDAQLVHWIDPDNYRHAKDMPIIWETMSPPPDSRQFCIKIEPFVTQDGHKNGRLCTIQDITKSSHSHSPSNSSQIHFKSDFLDIMSHELRTPLNAVTGHVNILRNTDLDSEQTELVKTILENGDKLSNIITDLLEYVHSDSEQIHLNPQPFDLKEMLQSICLAHHGRIYDKPVDLFWTIQKETPTILFGDFVRIRQILNYIVHNAIKYTEEGYVEILAEMIESPDDNPLSLKFSIKDTGIGIPEKYQTNVFNTFSQADNSLTRRHQGLGLSLAIAKKLCQHLGGKLAFHSEEGKGSTFYFTVQVQHSNIKPEALPEENRFALRNKRILLIGRNADYRRTISRDVKLAGMLPYVASSDSEVMFWLQRDIFDIICIEESLAITLPHLIDEIKDLPDYANTPLILIAEENSGLIDPTKYHSRIQAPLSPTSIYDVILRAIHNTKKGETVLPGLHHPNVMATHHPLSILVVEDNIINQRVIKRMLSKLGYEAAWATNGKMGVDMASKQAFDVILMDIQMPVMNGVEATTAIRNLKSNIMQPQIIAVTAHAREGDRERYIAAGMNDYMSKPIKIERLVEILHSCEAVSGLIPSSTPIPCESLASGINLSMLKSLFGDEINEFLYEMGPIFLEDSYKTIQKIKAAINLDDEKTLKDAAHALKGSSASMGMEKVSHLSSELEKMVMVGDLEDAPLVFAQLQEEYAHIVVELEELCTPA